MDFPGPRGVNGFSVGIHPAADAAKDCFGFGWKGSVGLGSHVEQQVSVLADDIYKFKHQLSGRLEGVALDVTPGFPAHGSVGLPGEFANAARQPALDVEHRSVLRISLTF